MLSYKIRPQSLLFKKLAALCSPFNTKPSFLPQWGFNQNLKPFFSSYKIAMYQFSSFSHNTRQTDYKRDLNILTHQPQEKLAYMSEVLEKYSQCEDLSLLTTDEVEAIALFLSELAHAYFIRKNVGKALEYAAKNEEFCRRVGIKDTLPLAQTYLILAAAITALSGQKFLPDVDHYLNEVDRICELLGEDRNAKSLRVDAWSFLIITENARNSDNTPREIANSILQRVENLPKDALPSVLTTASRAMKSIYASREAAEKMIEFQTKVFEIALKRFGKNSEITFEFSYEVTQSLSTYQPKDALPYAKQHLEIALGIFPKGSKEVADSYFMLGDVYDSLKNRSKALDSFEEALKFYERSPQEHLEVLGAIYRQSVFIYSYLKDFKGAANLLSKVELYKSFEPRDDGRIFELYYILSHIAEDEKDWLKMYKMCKECEKLRDKTELAIALSYELDVDLSAACIALGRTDEAEKYIQKVLQTGYLYGMVGPKYQILGNGFEKRGLLKEALDYYKRANREFEKLGERMNKDTLAQLIAKISELESKLTVTTN